MVSDEDFSDFLESFDVDINPDISEIYNSLKKKERIEALKYTKQGYNLTEISEQVGMSYSTIHNYLQDHKEAHLVKKENGGYIITKAGELVLGFVEELEPKIEEFMKKDAKSEINKISEEHNLSKEEIKDLLEE